MFKRDIGDKLTLIDFGGLFSAEIPMGTDDISCEDTSD
jgi:hypothetical protein